MLDSAIDHRARAGARAIGESNLEAAISSAEARIELETMFIEAARREIKVRAELFRILEDKGIDPAGPEGHKLQFHQFANARMQAEAIVEADEVLEMAQARVATEAGTPPA